MYRQIVEALKNRLLEFNYSESDCTLINDILFQSIIKTPRKHGVRYLCSVLNVPKEISDIADLQDYFELIRKNLSYKYAWSPFWKELGTYMILFCEPELFAKLNGKETLFVDKTGFHSNIILGIFFINNVSFENLACSTWGLLYSGKHFKAIKDTIDKINKPIEK